MITADLAEKLAADHDMPKSKIKSVLDAAFIAIGAAVAGGEEVSLPSFGKFKASDQPAREGRNPATGQPVQIAASRKGRLHACQAAQGQDEQRWVVAPRTIWGAAFASSRPGLPTDPARQLGDAAKSRT